MNKMTAVAGETVTKVKRQLKPKNKRTALMLSLPLLLAVVGLYFWLTSGQRVSTDNAAVKQDIVSVSAQIGGPVSEVAVEDGDHVKRGADCVGAGRTRRDVRDRRSMEIEALRQHRHAEIGRRL